MKSLKNIEVQKIAYEILNYARNTELISQDDMSIIVLKIKSILVTPACKGDLKKTKINRFFDNIIRKKQVKKGYLNKFERSDYYE